MTNNPSDSPPPIHSPLPHATPVGCAAYVIAGASFIPLIGVPFGIATIIWGVVRRAWALVGLGAGGIAFSVILYSSLFYFGLHQRGGVYDRLREQLAVTMLNNAVKDIEFYKLQHGHYPATLSELSTKDIKKPAYVTDPTALQRPGTKNGYFFYELDADGKSYFLRSVGADGIPFTSDDILPTFSDDERKNTGLKLER